MNLAQVLERPARVDRRVHLFRREFLFRSLRNEGSMVDDPALFVL